MELLLTMRPRQIRLRNYNNKRPLLPHFRMVHIILLNFSKTLSPFGSERHGSAVEKQKTFYAQFSLY